MAGKVKTAGAGGRASNRAGNKTSVVGRVSGWRRERDWVEPVEADRLIADGMSFLIQRAGSPDSSGSTGLAGFQPGWAERYVRDVRLFMLTWAEGRRYVRRGVTVEAMVGELWRSQTGVELLVFVQRRPVPRADAEADRWAALVELAESTELEELANTDPRSRVCS